MNITVYPSKLTGTILANASKSAMQRACAAALLRKGKSVIYNPGNSNDDKAALRIIKALGADWEVKDDVLEVRSGAVSDDGEAIAINCSESGLSIRMFTPLTALRSGKVTINGEGSLVTRPMNFFDEILPLLGVEIKSNNGKLPLVLQGPVRPASIEIDGSLSSQFLTGLLMAFAAAEADNVTIKVKDLKSKPYIDLTLDVMRRFGLNVPENKNYEEFVFSKNNRTHTDVVQYTVEGDWSGGAFLLVAGAIAGNIHVSGLQQTSTQADKKILEALMAANAGMAIDAKGITLHAGPLNAFEFDATDCPDLFPPLVALAAYCKGITKIKGVSRLAHKESDRGATLRDEFGKMGVQVDLEGDLMYVHGGRGVNGAKVHSRHDHRIAMACAVAALSAQGPVTIEEAEAVNKSYPDFYRHIKSLGARVEGGLDVPASLNGFFNK